MEWTREQQLDALMRLPWTITTEPGEDGEYLVGRVVEMPDAIGTGESERALARDLYASIRASLECRLEAGADLVLPPGHEIPWAHGASPRSPARVVVVRGHVAEWQSSDFRNTGAFARIDAGLQSA
jgi:hypothetical protein